ncbi:MAG: class I SAM-dependent rRNA methyltransferase [Cytophagales bacterium]|nr:MAG: class I SAM-dependent rRNA methyltransferase [Cytophagales bacterium]
MQKMATLVLKSGREKSILNQHPWIFSGAVKQLPNAENGEIVEVRDNHQQILGYGFFSPKSQIICRMFQFGNTIFQTFDAHYWAQKIENAYLMRKKYVLNAHTTTCRLLHAEGDGIPGIIADMYDKVLVVQVLTKGVERIFGLLLEAFTKLGFEYIYLKTKQNSAFLEEVNLEAGWLQNTWDMPLIVQEHGQKFRVEVEKGQKTGFFIDQRENRQLLKTYSTDKNILNAFAYTGGFSVYALQGNAKQVTSVDISKDACAICEENIQLNFEEAQSKQHEAIAADCFDYLRQTDQRYDLIVLDPPAFAKNARAVQNAARGYKDLNLLAFKNLQPNGILFTFSCSGNIDRDLFRKIVFSAAADSRRQVRIMHQLTQPLDHPISIYHPEGEYLKGLVLHVS